MPVRLLSPTAREVLHQDLLADKSDPNSSRRGDSQRFFCLHRGEERFRGPMSYLLKLALADILDGAPAPILEAGQRVMSKFINDNTSPETISFRVVNLSRKHGFGRALSSETASRFLFSQVLTAWANARFELAADGQQAVLYASPHPAVRQRRLNDSISDAFYRELFMSPCLSGWDRGESKRDYMTLCHQTLSRSQLNAVGKLREAGVITGNLVVLPNTSHVGLANNGTHVSLGSRTLSSAATAGGGFGAAEEKLVGDLAIKVVEHFLPLFVGAYSAAPIASILRTSTPSRPWASCRTSWITRICACSGGAGGARRGTASSAKRLARSVRNGSITCWPRRCVCAAISCPIFG